VNRLERKRYGMCGATVRVTYTYVYIYIYRKIGPLTSPGWLAPARQLYSSYSTSLHMNDLFLTFPCYFCCFLFLSILYSSIVLDFVLKKNNKLVGYSSSASIHNTRRITSGGYCQDSVNWRSVMIW